MGGDRGDAQGSDNIPPSGGAVDHGEDDKTRVVREWEYTAIEQKMYSIGLHPIGVFIKKRQTTILERVACRPVYELCEETERMQGTIWMVSWWDQDAVKDPRV